MSPAACLDADEAKSSCRRADLPRLPPLLSPRRLQLRAVRGPHIDVVTLRCRRWRDVAAALMSCADCEAKQNINSTIDRSSLLTIHKITSTRSPRKPTTMPVHPKEEEATGSKLHHPQPHFLPTRSISLTALLPCRPDRPGREGVRRLQRFVPLPPRCRQQGHERRRRDLRSPQGQPRPGHRRQPRRAGEQGGAQEEVRGAEQEVKRPLRIASRSRGSLSEHTRAMT